MTSDCGTVTEDSNDTENESNGTNTNVSSNDSSTDQKRDTNMDTSNTAKTGSDAETSPTNGTNESVVDWEARDRDILKWPCELQPHTSSHLTNDMDTDKERWAFLLRRATRFARKLTRPTPMETASFLHSYQSDSLILATKYDPTTTLLGMFPFLAPSCPFIVLSEHMEPLVECFKTLKDQELAINLRLSDTWMREFQVLPSRTHPQMTMSQSGGFLLTGIKVCPVHGIDSMDPEIIRQIKAELGGRRGKKQGERRKKAKTDKDPSSKRRKAKDSASPSKNTTNENKVDFDDSKPPRKKVKKIDLSENADDVNDNGLSSSKP